jgi:hypothetical protein
MPHRIEQPALFELTAGDEFGPRRGRAPEPASPGVTAKSDPSTPEGNVFAREPGVFRAVSPWASMPLRDVCAACGREISVAGFVILDEELGAFCNQDCGDRRFRSYLDEAPEWGTF